MTPRQRENFHRDGFLLLPRLAPASLWQPIRRLAEQWLEELAEPVEFESDLQYPGAPRSRSEQGGLTARRLLQVYQRHSWIQRWVHYPPLVEKLQAILGTPLLMPLAHHNCLMSKHPAYSSDSGWHQDLRYWSYQRGELITAWLALGEENANNGGLRLIPGSHRHRFEEQAFDEQRFFRTDLDDNQAWLKQALAVEMQAGDVLLFHSRLLHAASRNQGTETKLAAVFTFRHADDTPLPESRSQRGGDVAIAGN